MPESAVTTVLVVGCGYIGLPFARLALANGCRVYATTRKRERFVALAAEGFEPVRWDVNAGTAMAQKLISMGVPTEANASQIRKAYREIRESKNDVLPTVDAVVYCVGFDRSAGPTMEEVYLGGLMETLNELKGRPKFVYASSTGVYGDCNGEWIAEDVSPAPTDSGGENCFKAEIGLKVLADGMSLNHSILRFAGLYGRGRMIGAEALQRGEPVPGDGAAWLNLVHQDDAAEALWKAVLNGEPGEIYNIADGHPVRRQDYYLKLAELLNAPPPTFAPELARRQRGNRRINADKARWKLGWAPRYPSYVEGLEAAVKLK